MKNNNDFVEIFEQRLCDFTGAPYAVAVDRCTNAILLCLEYLRRYGDGTLDLHTLRIPARTYISVPMTLIQHGYRVTLTDKEWGTAYQIDNTPVWDYAVGFREDMYIPGQHQCLSFQQKKRLPIGKGGAILTDDPVMAATLRRMRHDGRNSAIPVEQDKHIIFGYHMYMSPDEAAKGILLINQPLAGYRPGSSARYPDARTIPCLENYV